MAFEWRGVTQFIFENLLVAYVLLVMVDWFWPASVSHYLTLGYLQVATIVVGLVAVVWPPAPKPLRAMTVNEGIVAGGVGVAVAAFMLTHAMDLGWFSWTLPVLSGILVVLVGGVARGRDDREPSFVLSWTTALFALLALVVIAGVLSFILGSRAWQLVFGTVFAFFIPGFAASLALYPPDDARAPGWIERTGLAVALSVLLVPLMVFYLNLLGVRISTMGVVVSVALIMTVSLSIVWRRVRKKRLALGVPAAATTAATPEKRLHETSHGKPGSPSTATGTPKGRRGAARRKGKRGA